MLSSVSVSLSGYIRANNGLRLIEDRNCIVRLDNGKNKVKLISGGGSGHEPAHIGYVGVGMLDAAVCGDVFCSPSATSIVDCLRTVADPEESVLFIVNNYTGDRLNFGLAVERAESLYGYKKLRILLNDDDCSIDSTLVRKSVGKRGLAGSVLLIKILGAMAELAFTAEEIYRVGDELLRNGHLITFGFTFEVANGKLHNIELGKGLHGEPGVYKMDTSDNFEPIIQFMMTKLDGKFKPSADVVVLINNLGGTSEFHVGIFIETLSAILEKCYRIHRVYSGTFFSSLNQCGLSVTLLNLTYSDNLLRYLDYKVQVASPLFGSTSFHLPASKVINFQDKNSSKITASTQSFKLEVCGEAKSHIRSALEHISHTLLSSRELLNAYDRECGDGDTGTTIANGASALLANLSTGIDLQHPAKMLQDISLIMQLSIGGTSGAIYSLFFQAASKAFVGADNDPKITVQHWINALTHGNDAIMRHALTEVGDRTMLDPLREAELQLRNSIQENLPTAGYIRIFAETCERVAEATRRMIPKSGRASYSASESKQVHYNYPDPGAHAVAVWARGLCDAFKRD
ncbi:triokinase/FMN cyclase-like [Topomyia yanbarensis]|uniref:triokinase/FMN cyclase-like n=1 Tax=Topomyia yanbarensis TaxID=2498891 RepID=UPI00273C3E87|nr:triokinase/FMN cyclase-like [Topomyia yanbarensis]